MHHVEVKGVSKKFGDHEVMKDVSLAIENGEFCALLGPSGCGKSTLLRMICGLETVTKGAILISGKDVTNVPPAKRRIAMVFQSYALYPHMTVRQNIGFSLSVAGLPKPQIKSRTEEIATMLQLGELMERKPSALSGGQRQRVAIGRSLVRSPEVFLFDEPLSNLDAKLRVQMRLEISRLHKELKTTMIYVTHDQVEAMTLADRIVVLDAGRVSQVGAPLELYHKPDNVFVASFIGSPGMNFLPTRSVDVQGDSIRLVFSGDETLEVRRRAGALSSSSPAEVGIRPEHVILTEPESEKTVFVGTAEFIERLGNSTIVHIAADVGQVTAQGDGDLDIKAGERVGVAFEPDRIHLFDQSGRAV